MPVRLLTAAQLEAAFAAERFLVFKHSTRCSISAAAFEEYSRWSEAHPDVVTAWIDVIQDRPLAQAVAEHTGVRHESPQAILLVHGAARWNASHGAITRVSLNAAVAQAPASIPRTA